MHNRFLVVMVVALLFGMMTVYSALAGDVEINDGCHSGALDGGTLVIENNCTGGTTVSFENVSLGILGPVVDGEVKLSQRSVVVDTVARPDLEVPAHITFKDVGFVIDPVLLKNGGSCGMDCNNSVFNSRHQTYDVDVGGFSNYTLTGSQDFVVNSDPQAELDNKVYQTIDLGNSNRNKSFTCVVQIYGRNEQSEWVLVQTNPKREIQARMFGSPDQNQPESLGYFPTTNGLANVYYDGGSLAGYEDFEYVAQCADSSDKLVYEESISTRYHPLGRAAVGRGVWLTDGNNAIYLVIYVVGGFIGLFLAVRVIRVVWASLTGRRR